MRSRTACFLVVFLAYLLVIQVAFAQTTSGQINGRVVDPDGQSIVNAEVTLTNRLTSEQRVEKTDASGDFVFVSVQPGTYNVTITAQGFKTFTKNGLVLTASERLSAGSLHMQTGIVSQSVEVNADATPVQTESGERSALLDEHQVANLLNPARNYMQLNRILPGVVATNNVGSDQLGILGVDTVNGVRSEYNSASVDGIAANTRGRDQIETPLNMDAVSEVKILTNNYQAEYGGTSGAPINAVTKSGTRDFHGTAYYFKRHEQFNANQFFNSRFWNQDANGNPVEVAKPLNRFNTIGYSFGGPVWIPKVNFNRNRDKVFFFFSQEIWPTVHPGDDSPFHLTVPTALERQGDFSQSTDNTGKAIKLKDPKSCGLAANQNCLLDPTHINPVFINSDMQKILNLLPLPNFTPNAQNGFKFNYQTNVTEKNPVNQRLLRLDFNISPKWHAYFRGLDMTVKSQGSDAAFLPMIWLTTLPVDYDNHSPNVTFDVTYIASPTLVNEFTVGYAGWSEQQVFPNGGSELASVEKSALGIMVGQFRPQLNPRGLIPTLTLGGGNLSNAPAIGFSGSGGRFPINSQASSYDISDGLTKVWAGHTSKAGIYLHFDRFVQLHNAGNFAGNYDFTNDTNNPLNAGFAYANALLGNFRQYSESTGAPDSDPTTRIVDWYVQDHWKIVKNFTLDYGLRFSWDLPQHLHAGANFVPALVDPAQAPVLYQPILVGKTRMGRDPRTGTIVPGQLIGAVVPGSGNPFNGLVTVTDNNLIRSQGLLVAPRLGFAWDVFGDGKTAMRGGFGVFYNSRPPASQAGDLTVNPPVQSNPTNPFGNVSTLFAGSSTSVIFPSGLNRALQGNGNRPVFYNFSFGVQHNLGFQTVLDIAYVGTVGRHLGEGVDLNALPPGTRFLSTSQDPTSPGKPLADNFLRRYVGLGGIPFTLFEGTSNYHALQISATRRFSHGLEFGVNYTWSKALDFSDATTAGVANFAPIHAYNYGLAGFDRDHAVKINWLWDIPKASRLWDNLFMRQALDNWQLSGIASFIRGAPQGINLNTSGTDITGGGDAARVLLLANPALSWGNVSRLQYFNTSLIAAPSINTIGSNGQYSNFVGNAGKVVFRGPGTDKWDVALFKNFPIRERLTFQFRSEFYNLFNHPSFTGVDNTAQFKYSGGQPGPQLNPTFGQVNKELGPRQIQFSARISF